MSVEENKEVVRRLFTAQVKGDLDTLANLLADDLAWQYMGNGTQDVTINKDQAVAMHRRMREGWIEAWVKNIVGMIAEGDGVAVEATNRMKMKDGRIYEQRYHYVYIIKNGKISAVREYLDTDHAKRFFENRFP